MENIKEQFARLYMELDLTDDQAAMINKLQKDVNAALGLAHVSKSLPIKKYEIDFDGNVLAGIEISENTPKVFGAMNGYGNGISIENIKITEK